MSIRTTRCEASRADIKGLVCFLLSCVCGVQLFAQAILVKPYVQPGNGSTLTGNDVKVIAWMTDQIPGLFTVTFAAKGLPARVAVPERVRLDFQLPRALSPTRTPTPATPVPEGIATSVEDLKTEKAPAIPERGQHYFKYAATLTDLPFDSEVAYEVRLREKTIRGGVFRTRSSAMRPIRFVAVGDLAKATEQQNKVAFQIARANPQFVVALGDIVYPSGRVNQYMHHFWGTYNQPPRTGEKTGAPLMQSIPIYPVLGNHDVDNAKLPNFPDAYAAYYFFNVPRNGPGDGAWNTPLGKDATMAAAFRKNAGPSYPALGHYSFDNGAAHFLVLDTGSYNKFDQPALLSWIADDLKRSAAHWKFVCCHAPGFHTSREHYTEQKIRLLEPLFEAGGVDIVFAGHVHNYQRSKPLRFTPLPPKRDGRGRVNGQFVLDEKFNGVDSTRPDGVIHIVSGGGGASLYSVDFAKTVERLQKEQLQNWVPFTAKYLAVHSFTVIDLTPTDLLLRQIDSNGQEIDKIRITK